MSDVVISAAGKGVPLKTTNERNCCRHGTPTRGCRRFRGTSSWEVSYSARYACCTHLRHRQIRSGQRCNTCAADDRSTAVRRLIQAGVKKPRGRRRSHWCILACLFPELVCPTAGTATSNGMTLRLKGRRLSPLWDCSRHTGKTGRQTERSEMRSTVAGRGCEVTADPCGFHRTDRFPLAGTRIPAPT